MRTSPAQGAITADRPRLALGMRNSLVNLRCPVIIDGPVHAVSGEAPQQSSRPHYGIGAYDGRLTMGLALGDSRDDWSDADFFCAAVPVLDERLEQLALLDAILTEAADHSHMFDLPRGNHPLATDASRAAWAHLHDAFTANLYTDRTQAAAAMRVALAGLHATPPRWTDYLHAVLGVGASPGIIGPDSSPFPRHTFQSIAR